MTRPTITCVPCGSPTTRSPSGELLSYSGGVDNPASGYADSVPSLASLFGPVLPCSGPRGTARAGRHGDYAALGQLIAEALRPQAAEASSPGRVDLGWRLNTARGFAFETGNGPGGSASLIVRPSDNHTYVALTNWKVPVMPLSARVFLRGS
jgi:hypothetical protein